MKSFLRYIVSGAVLNASGYLLYLLITLMMPVPVLSATIVYFVGFTAGYILHTNYTFRISSLLDKNSIPRYAIAHAIGYATNVVILAFFVNYAGLAHQWAQLLAIAIVGLVLFVLFRFYVYPSSHGTKTTSV
jgi:putative flippase GtrA